MTTEQIKPQIVADQLTHVQLSNLNYYTSEAELELLLEEYKW